MAEKTKSRFSRIQVFAVLLIVLGLFLVLSGLNVRYYHTHPTALGSHHFLYIPPQHGYELQKYLVDYPVSDMKYPVFRDGRVVLTTDGENR